MWGRVISCSVSITPWRALVATTRLVIANYTGLMAITLEGLLLI